MKILFSIAEHYPTHRADVNVLFGKHLRSHGIQSDLLTLNAAGSSPPPWPGGALLIMNGSASRLGKHLRTIASDLRILKLGGTGYDAIQVRDKALAALIGLIAARFYGIRFYYWMSFPTPEAWSAFAAERGLSAGLLRMLLAWLRGKAMRILLYRVVLPRADHVFVQSQHMREMLTVRGVPDERMTSVPMGVDKEALIAEMPIEAPFERPTFVYLGTLDRNRSPDMMIEAIDIVRQRVPSAQLLLIGSADEAQDFVLLKELVHKRGLLDHVRITGWLPMAEGWQLAKRCLAGLSPVPRSELFDVGSPTKAVEYFGLGLPVVANDQPDQVLVLAGAGASCVPFTAAAFAERMLDIIDDPAHYRQQALAGQRWVMSQRNYSVLAARVAAIYQKPEASPVANA